MLIKEFEKNKTWKLMSCTVIFSKSVMIHRSKRVCYLFIYFLENGFISVLLVFFYGKAICSLRKERKNYKFGHKISIKVRYAD